MHQADFRRSWRLLVASAATAITLVALLVGSLLYASHQRYLGTVEDSTQNLSLSLENFLGNHFKAIELALQNASREHTRLHLSGEYSDERFSAYLAGLRERIPNAVGVRGTNARGEVVFGEEIDRAHIRSVADREYFIRARDSQELLIGLPVVSRITGEWLFPVVQPLRNPDGQFAGLAYVNTSHAHLRDVFSAFKLGQQGVITLFDARRHILLRYPLAPGATTESVVNRQPPSPEQSPTLQALVAGKRQFTYSEPSTVDGVRRIMTFRQIGNYPLYVLVGLGVDEALAPWRREAMLAAMFLGVLMITTVALLLNVRRHWLRDAQMQSLRATQASHLHLSAVLAAIPDALFEMDVDGRFLEAPPGTTPVSAWLPGALAGRHAIDALPGPEAQVLLGALAQAREQGHAYGAQLHLASRAGTRWFELSVARKDNPAGGEPTLIVLSRDITERKQAEAQIEQLAFTDLLTQLPNRRLFSDRLRQSMANSQRNGRLSALLFLDLDQFKAINDSMGHQYGDLLLVQTAQRLRKLVRDGDTVARLGGDEFVVILEQLGTNADEASAQAMVVAEKIGHQLDCEYELGGRLYRSTVSVGITLFHGQELSQEELIKRADMAMYQAKTAGRNAVRFFDPRSQAQFEARLTLQADLQRALEQHEFQLHYQPQIDARGRCVGAEALVRWHHPLRGMVPPGEFIPVAEETGQIVALGREVMRAACVQLSRWRNDPALEPLTLAVNVSARQFAGAGFVGEVRQLIEQHRIRPSRLKLELTESMLVDQIDEVAAKMRELGALGVHFSLDDFGTGFSSLSYLKRLPFSQIKIDQTFVRDVMNDPNDAGICRAIIALGQSLGVEVIAEGVETAEQLAFLQDEGCAYMQGYLIGRPMPAEALAQWVEASLATQALLRPA